MKLTDFYCECAALVRRDLVKQKMLLPPETINSLCSEHHREHRSLLEKLSKSTSPCRIKALQKAFPRSGTELQDFNALEVSKIYEAQKVAALAVVTEKHFYKGEPSLLTGVSHMVNLPIIRWDFIVDSYQLIQSKLWGADAVRIIVPLLDQSELELIYQQAVKLDLELVWEVHSMTDIERIKKFDLSRIIYLEGEDLTCQTAQDILKKLPYSSPSLLNGDNKLLSDVPENLYSGTINFTPES